MTARRLYSASEIGKLLGHSRDWVLRHVDSPGCPPVEFTASHGRFLQPLWSQESLDRWRAYDAGETPITPGVDRYSDHNAVNYVGSVRSTWRLWWRPTFDGAVMWWFSTPQGWYVSNDDGRTWDDADVMIRPTNYRYHCINSTVRPSRHTCSVLRSADRLRGQLERDNAIDISSSTVYPQQQQLEGSGA